MWPKHSEWEPGSGDDVGGPGSSTKMGCVQLQPPHPTGSRHCYWLVVQAYSMTPGASASSQKQNSEEVTSKAKKTHQIRPWLLKCHLEVTHVISTNTELVKACQAHDTPNVKRSRERGHPLKTQRGEQKWREKN